MPNPSTLAAQEEQTRNDRPLMERRTIRVLIGGARGTGKTTLANLLKGVLDRHEIPATIKDDTDEPGFGEGHFPATTDVEIETVLLREPLLVLPGVELLSENARLKKELAESEKRLNEYIAERNTEYVNNNLKLGELAANIRDIKGALALLGRDLLETQQSRDRVLTENCALTQKNRDLASTIRRLGAAARELLQAGQEFGDAAVPTDAQTERAANAACELEKLLDESGL